MPEPRRRRTQEARWIITFADLITLLFCFFVFLSLFSKTSISIQSEFRIPETLASEENFDLPREVREALRPAVGAVFETEDRFLDFLSSSLSEAQASNYDSLILTRSLVAERVKESSGSAEVRVFLREPLDLDLTIPLIFSGTANKLLLEGVSCEEVRQRTSRFSGVDYVVSRESIMLPKGELEAGMEVCILDDQLYEQEERILVQMGSLSGDVERGAIISKSILIEDDEAPPEVSFTELRRDLYEGTASFTATLNRVSSLETVVPIRFSGTAAEGVDFQLAGDPVIRIFPFTEKGSYQIRITQDEVPLYATKSLIVDLQEEGASNVALGEQSRQVNTIVGALEMKDCSGIHRFLRENQQEFSRFELRASKSQCVLSLPSEYLFSSGSAQIQEANRSRLEDLMQAILSRYELENDEIRVEGHTDDVPMANRTRFSSNWELSLARAMSVGAFMMDVVGFDPQKIAIAGYADTRPKIPYATPSGQPIARQELSLARAANRRVDLVFVKPAESETFRKFFPQND